MAAPNIPGINGFAAKVLATLAAAGLIGAGGALVRGEVHGDRLNRHLEQVGEVPDKVSRIDERTKYFERDMLEIKSMLRSIQVNQRRDRRASDDAEDDGE